MGTGFEVKDFKEGLVYSFPFKVTTEQMTTYASLSGDLNPIHLDEAYARQLGFKGQVVYGGLLVSAVSRMLGMHLPGPGCLWHSLSIQFKAPLFIDEEAEIHATIDYVNMELGILRIKIKISREDKTIVEGAAQAGLFKPAKADA